MVAGASSDSQIAALRLFRLLHNAHVDCALARRVNGDALVLSHFRHAEAVVGVKVTLA